jgi:hypothetical protein
MKGIFLIFALLALSILQSEADSKINLYSANCWEIAGPPGKITWVEIHKGLGEESTGVVHVEVLSRKKDSPVWEIKHVCSHVAITTDALQRSVIRPLKILTVYPETFEGGYRSWKEASEKAPPVICTTSIQDFLKSNLKN